MCGIFGVISRPGSFDEARIQKALNTIQHRGPDDWGIQKFTANSNWEVWLSQRRLAIVDLSAAGHQPMVARHKESQDLRGAIVFNGEIYNHQDLRRTFSDRWTYQSRSDTEVLLAGLFLEGPKVLKQMNAMMAFGFLNYERQEIILARDRVGKKPLYVYETPDLLVFSSELKPLVSLGIPLTIDAEAVALYRWLGYIPAEKTVYKECRKFPAASYATIDLKERASLRVDAKLYWDPLLGYQKKYSGSYAEAKAEFLSLLDDATKMRLEADVPVGVFLSGGIDSSLVLSSVAAQTRGNVSGFTVRFQDPEFDESPIAIDTAKQLGVSLTLLDLVQHDFDRQLDKIPYYFDEPFSDSSQIPTLAIAEAARKHVTVVLTGDGGDEVFLGYPRYSNQARLRKMLYAFKVIPGLTPLALGFVRHRLGRRLFAKVLEMSGMGSASANLDAKIARLHYMLSLRDLGQIYETIMCVQQKDWLDVETRQSLGDKSLKNKIMEWYPGYGWDALKSRSFEEQAAALDLVTYMRDDVLVKVDRATMAYSLEARSPLLDYRIIEFGCSLPHDFKIGAGFHKRILRDALSERLRGNVLKLGKKGFGVPLPLNLPAGQTPYARWNTFIEQQWRQQTLG